MLYRKQQTVLGGVWEGVKNVASILWKCKTAVLVGVSAAIYAGREKNSAATESAGGAVRCLVRMPKQIDLPFDQAAILSKLHQGVAFPYDTTQADVVCDLQNTYKAWVHEENGTQVSPTVGGNHSFIFYSENKYKNNRTAENETFVNLSKQTGTLVIDAITKPGEENVVSTVSCRQFRS